jgi:hypothetical protein
MPQRRALLRRLHDYQGVLQGIFEKTRLGAAQQ